MKPFFALSLLALAACTPTGDPAPLEDWTPGIPSTGTDTGSTDTGSVDTNPLGGLLGVDVNLAYDTRFGTTADPTVACDIDTNAAAFTELDCQMEVNELDLYFNGWSYELSVPSNTCEYLGVESYMYEAWHHGTGPTLVQYKVDEAGNWLSDTLNASGGDPECEFDYTNPLDSEAPNCCYGTYQVEVTVVDSTGAETVQPISEPIEWGGGSVGSCYAGAAFMSSVSAIDPISGLPRYVVVDIDEDIDNVFSVSFSAPIDKPESTNVTVANYYNTADGVPAGLVGPHSRDVYVIECLDHAYEVSARFNMSVREWDQVAEFDAEGNPNSGIQASAGAAAPMETNGSGSPINDFWDWADFALNSIDYVGSLD